MNEKDLAKLKDQDMKLYLFLGAPILFAGQYIRDFKDHGQFIFPQFARHHLSNMADAACLGMTIDLAQRTLCDLFNYPVKSRPIVSAALAFAVCTGWEAYEATMPKRHFDVVDESIHAVSAAAYAGLATLRNRKYSKEADDTATPEGIKCLALDIGGVFHSDVWERVAENYPFSDEDVKKHAGEIWDLHAHSQSSEDAYWDSWEERLGHKLDREKIAAIIDEHVWVDTSVLALVERCFEKGIDVCFVSNSTNFWYDRQMASSGLDKVVDRITPYLSHELGHPKTHPDGGLAKLAADRDPATVLFVDDRKGNTDKAEALGMQTLLYTHDPKVTLAEALEEKLFGKQASPAPLPKGYGIQPVVF